MIVEQNGLKQLVSIVDDKNINDINFIGGVDISFDKGDPDRACVYLTVLDKTTHKVLYEDYEIVKLTMPYISGLLGFREVPHFILLIERLKNNNHYLMPDVILVDGFGTLHHRSFGSASHLGVISNISTVGCVKTLLIIDGLNERHVKEYMNKHSLTEYDLKGESGTIYGRAIITNSTINPIFVSIGHKISLDTASQLVKSLCDYRIPEPIRLADIRSKLYF